MSQDLLIDLADCGSPETLVAAILKHHPDLPRPVPVEDLARAVGIQDIKDLEVDGFEGGLISNEQKSAGYVMVRLGMAPRRRRFTIGHELGHFLIPTHQGAQQCTKQDLRETRRDDIYRRREAEANRFSAGLLMPKPMFTRDMLELGSVDVAHIRQLGDLYDTSMEATANRYVELSREACAIVFAHEGIVRYARSSRAFPRLLVERGSKLPLMAAATRSGASSGVQPWREVPGGVWLECELGRRPSAVLEQHLIQANGYSVIILQVEDQELEEREEAEDLTERWRVGFRKG